MIEERERMLHKQPMEAAAGGPLLGSSSSRENAPPPMLGVRPPRVITTKPQVPISDQELRARVQWAHKTSPHFQLSYDRIAFSEPRATMLIEELEIAYNLIFHFTHESFTDRFPVYAIDQRATTLLGRSVHSHLNLEEHAIYLVENSHERIYAEVVGQLTHAMRIARYKRHYDHTSGWAALEEAFSIFLSERLSMMPEVFPFFGGQADVIAYHLYRKQGQRLQDIWVAPARSHTIDQLVLAGAFVLYLGDTFSDDRIVTFSLCDDPITSDTFKTFFGSSLDSLEAAWVDHLPTSLLALTHEEKEGMVQHWESSIEGQRHLVH
jgi:hypothetical protein